MDSIGTDRYADIERDTDWGSRVRWGLSAEKWGFRTTAALSNQLIRFDTLASLDLSARF